MGEAAGSNPRDPAPGQIAGGLLGAVAMEEKESHSRTVEGWEGTSVKPKQSWAGSCLSVHRKTAADLGLKSFWPQSSGVPTAACPREPRAPPGSEDPSVPQWGGVAGTVSPVFEPT